MPSTTRPPVLDRLSVLADTTRSRLLLLLDRFELSVGELCAVLQLPQSTVSRHLKLLSDEDWIVARGDGTSRFYKMVPSRLDPPTRTVWSILREQMASSPGAAHDIRRAEGVLAKRRDKAQIFFTNSAEKWDRLRTKMIGARTDLLALLDLLDERWVVADLGCGTGQISEALAPCVAHVIAVDESGRCSAWRAIGWRRRRTSICARGRSRSCRSTTRASTPRCCFSSRTSSPIRQR